MYEVRDYTLRTSAIHFSVTGTARQGMSFIAHGRVDAVLIQETRLMQSMLRNVPEPTCASKRMAKQVFGITGLSNSGKTTLIERLIVHFRSDGYVVSSIKHAHHGLEIDRPGKDSWRMREAGAQEVMLIGERQQILMQTFGGGPEPTLESLVARLAPCDLVLVEGFKSSSTPKIEVFRPSLGRPPVWPQQPSVVAVASDEPLNCPLPTLDLNNPVEIAAFLKTRLF